MISFFIPVTDTIKHDEDDGHTEWEFEFEAYPPVDEDQVKLVVMDKTTSQRTKLSLGDSTSDNIFMAKPNIERTSSYGEPVKHKIVLQIQPQNNEASNSQFDVKFIIKVPKKLNILGLKSFYVKYQLMIIVFDIN